MGSVGDAASSLFGAFAGPVANFAVDTGKCLAILLDCKNAVTSAENTLNIHTVGVCGGLGYFLTFFVGPGYGGNVQACLIVTGKGQAALTFSGASGQGGGLVTAGGGSGLMFSNAQDTIDQANQFNYGDINGGIFEWSAEQGSGHCSGNPNPVTTTYGGLQTPGFPSGWAGNSWTAVVPLFGPQPQKC